MEIIEGNIAIAVFMGAIDETGYFQASTIGKTKVPTGRMWMSGRFPSNMHLCSESDLQYHSSWDWLMPVVEKIHLKRCVREVSITPGRTRIWFNSELKKSFIQSPCLPENNSIMECWQAVVQFITWYNQTQTTPS